MSFTEPLRASGFSSGLISTTVHSRQRWPSFQPCSFGQNAQTRRRVESASPLPRYSPSVWRHGGSAALRSACVSG
jgi:hypothetical protein